MIATLETWARNGERLFVILDEIHHASEDNKWGAAVEKLGQIAVRILSMTGTCFRSDKRRMTFVKYDHEGKALSDYNYGYREAVRDRVCRPVEFRTDDSITQYVLDEKDYKIRISEAGTKEEVRWATNSIFRSDHDFLRGVLEKADAELDEYQTWDRDAGGLIVCRSGKNTETDNRYLHLMADLVYNVLGERPEVVSYDDADAVAKIERFRKSSQRWICAVRMIIEGVDIKRLRTMVMATRPTSELLFRQLVGRVVRVDDERKPGSATVFMPKFPNLTEFARKISEEALAGIDLQPKPKKEKGAGDEEGQSPASQFISLGATYEHGGAISDYGDQYNEDEINAAERLRRGDPQLSDIPITKIAYLNRKLGNIPEPMASADPPLHAKKNQLRTSIVKKQRKLAIVRNPVEPNYKMVWREIGAAFGPHNADDLVENYSLDVMRQIDEWLAVKLTRIANATR
jgi:superfamily II DNA or RNA helicase